MKRIHLTLFIVLTAACDRNRRADERVATATVALRTGEISAGITAVAHGARASFNGNVEVDVTFSSRRGTPARLSEIALTARSGDSLLALHPLSVGRGKELLIPVNGSVSTTLLFEGGGVAGSILDVFGTSTRVLDRRPAEAAPPAPVTLSDVK